jgi:hypothetical protein
MRNRIKNNWITQGIKTSSKRMRLLDKQRKTTTIKKKDLEYIERYRKIYKRVIQNAKRRENDNYISSSKNKAKATWQLINKELGKPFQNNKNIELKWGKSVISNPTVISELFNSYYAETIEKVSAHYPIPVVVLLKIYKIPLFSCNCLLIQRKMLTSKEEFEFWEEREVRGSQTWGIGLIFQQFIVQIP